MLTGKRGFGDKNLTSHPERNLYNQDSLLNEKTDSQITKKGDKDWHWLWRINFLIDCGCR